MHIPAEPGPDRAVRRQVPAHQLLLLGLLIALLLLGTLPPLINLGRYQRRIAGAISHAVGRPVSMDGISLQMLPWPGFRIENFVVDEDPGFGQEPALRAPQVVLEPSLLSLWRGRFEISKVELTDASVNLVRDQNGRWNISSVLLQASQIPNAPTGAHHPGHTPRFPYIDATDTRINFKRGVEKLPYSILNADFSMWLDRPGVWALRLEGQPVRTDLPMGSGDTGTVRLEGEVHRASAFGTMPVKLDAEWSHAPLGQAGRLLLGRDTGWRGQADLHARFSGEIDNLRVSSELAVNSLHWQDFTPEAPFMAQVDCRGRYSRDFPATDSFLCRWPLGDGSLVLRSPAVVAGKMRSLSLAVQDAPVSVAAAAIGLLHSSMPGPGAFSGALNGQLTYQPATRRLTGSLAAPAVGIEGATVDGGALELTDVSIAPGAGDTPALTLTCDPVALGASAAPLRLSAVLAPHGYSASAQGGASLEALNAAAAALHLPGLTQVSAARPGGVPVRLALSADGPWRNPGNTGFAGKATGSLRLVNVMWQPVWLSTPVMLPGMTLVLAPGQARWTVPTATIEAGTGAPLRFSASLEQALGCAPGPACRTRFAVTAPQLSTSALQTVLATGHSALLGRLLAQFDPRRLRLPAVEGTLQVETFTLGKLPIQGASVSLRTEDRPDAPPVIRIQSLDGNALGGTLHLAGAIAASGTAPIYTLVIAVSGASAAQAGALWHGSWGSGLLGGTAQFTLAGADLDDLLSSAHGTFQASWQGGSLGHAVPHFASWDAAGTLGSSGLTLSRGVLSGTPATLTGSIGWDRSLHLALTPAPGAAPTQIGGTVADPVVTATP